jgi:hypothetical protein
MSVLQNLTNKFILKFISYKNSIGTKKDKSKKKEEVKAFSYYELSAKLLRTTNKTIGVPNED